MIQKQSNDPDVEKAAAQAHKIVETTLKQLPRALSYDYGGHQLNIGDYGVCDYCTTSIAESQQAEVALRAIAQKTEDPTIKEHLLVVSELFKLEAETAIIRAKLHSGHGTENIINTILGFNFTRNIDDSYQHSHSGAK